MKKSFFVTYRSPLLILIFLILTGGIYSYTKIQSALFPQVTFPKIKIIADAGQQPVSQMSVGVTKVLENAIKKVPDLQVLKSTTTSVLGFDSVVDSSVVAASFFLQLSAEVITNMRYKNFFMAIG